jgi:CRISPR-associated endonuclease/helicase Cas3
MAFALAHAERHGLDRVIVAIPFMSIIEQSAEAYRKALGDGAVLEHHSAIEPDRETARSRVAVENWDAPVVVTSNVQLFESLLANRPSACRKLHRIAKSVIVLDEAQALPPGMLAPTLDVLGALVRHFGVSIVISTATQPAFSASAAFPEGLEGVREIVPPETRAFERLRRVRVRWPASEDRPADFEALADDISREEDVLAIVHRRDDARILCEAIDKRLGARSTLHLSALMCAEHRSRVLADVKARKWRGEPVRLVSTQVVEAGVDLDFAVVYRAMGGLDALAQAAGRCNREGRREFGELRVFRAPTDPPRGVLSSGLAVANGMRATRPDLDLFQPAEHKTYFERLYNVQSRDSKGIQSHREGLKFKTVASLYRLIDDAWAAPIVVPYPGSAARVAELERLGPSRNRLRPLQRYLVNVPRRHREAWLAAGALRLVAETVAVLDGAFAGAYDCDRFGLVPEGVGIGDPSAFIIA